MRSFSDFEKQIIECMIELDNSETSNVLDNLVGRLGFFVNANYYVYVGSESDVVIRYRNVEGTTQDALSTIHRVFVGKLLVMVMLFEYLQEERLAFFQRKIKLPVLGQKWTDETDKPYVTFDFFDIETKALIYKYTQKEFFLTETLRVLASNQFKSEEELRHEEIHRSTQKQWLFTLVAFVGSVLLSIFISLYVPTTVTIKDNAISTSITHSADLVSDKIGSLENELKEMNSAIRHSAGNFPNKTPKAPSHGNAKTSHNFLATGSREIKIP